MTKVRLSLVFTCCISLISATFASNAQTINTICGTGLQGYTGDGGPAYGAQLYKPADIKTDNKGNAYIADWGNEVIRKIDANGNITTFAGTGNPNFYGDGGPATAADFNQPTGVAADNFGNVFVADSWNHVVRRIDTGGIISTYAGVPLQSGYRGNGGPATAAWLSVPTNLATDSAGNLYIAERGNNVVRMVERSTGIIFVVAGNTINGYSGDGGPGPAAELSTPCGIYVDVFGNLFIADYGNDVVRKVDAITKHIHTIAGVNWPGYSGNFGPATAAMIHGPKGVAADQFGNVYIAEWDNDIVRKILPDSTIVPFAGNTNNGFSGDGGPATAAEIGGAYTLALDGVGNVYFPDFNNNAIRRVQVSPLAVKNVNQSGSIQVYPNPVTSFFHINGLTKELSYSLTDVLGNSMRYGILKAGDNTVDASDIPSGIYFLKFTNEEGLVEVKKITKE